MGARSIKKEDKKKSKNQLRRERAKLQKQQDVKSIDRPEDVCIVIKPSPIIVPDSTTPSGPPKKKRRTEQDGDAEKEKETELEELYKDVFQKFDPESYKTEDASQSESTAEVDTQADNTVTDNGQIINRELTGDNDDNDVNRQQPSALTDTNSNDSRNELSKRQFKKLYSIPLYVLKSETKRPELVEWIDANSSDPRLYIYMKTMHNAVPIPSHWNSKKSFLSSKRGIERPPFELPQFIKDTGILEMRQTGPDAEEDTSTLKQKMRERVQPKSGQLDLDYDKLHDAFFKYQRKPPLLKFGECYTESFNNDDIVLREKVSQIRVGVLSRRLKIALGMIDEEGTVKSRIPPWYRRMTEIGPPPSYPHMRIDPNTGVITPNVVTSGVNESKHWGTLVNDLNTSVKYGKLTQEEEEEEEGKENENVNDEKLQTKSRYDSAKGDVLLKSFGSDPTSKQAFVGRNDSNSSTHPQRLYQVLHSKDSGDDKSLFGPKATSYQYQR